MSRRASGLPVKSYTLERWFLKTDDLSEIFFSLIAIVDNKPLFRDLILIVKVQYQVNIEGWWGLQIHFMFQGLIDHMKKMIAFGTVTKMIFAFITIVFYGPVKQIPWFFNLIANFRQIDKPEWGTMLFDQMFQGYTMKSQIPVSQVKSFLWEVVGLLY